MGTKLKNIGGAKSIDAYVSRKLKQLEGCEESFRGLFPCMFSEKENVFYERTVAFKAEKISYGEAEAAILKRKKVLSEMLLSEPFDAVVGLYMQNSPEWLINFWALLASGHSVLLMNLRLDDSALNDALKDTGAVAVISDKKTFPIRTIQENEIRKEAEKVLAEEARRDDGKPFGSSFLIMTSGTSSRGRVAAYTAPRVFSALKNSARIVKDSALMKRHYHGELKQLCFLPFYHIFGLEAVYLWFGFYQRTFVELKDMTPETILSTIRDHEVTHIFAVPLLWEKVYREAMKTIAARGEKTLRQFEKGMALYDRMAHFPVLQRFFSKTAFREVRENLFGESISFLISGGGPIRPEVLRFFNAIGYRLANGYGMTEIGITSVELSDDQSLLNSGSVGKPLDSVEYRVNAEGELLVRGASVAKAVMTDGVKQELTDWFETKDLAECRDGRYYVLGRKDDLIVSSNGENLNPNTVETKMDLAGAEGICLTALTENGAVCPVMLVSVDPRITGEALGELKDRVYRRISELKLRESISKVLFTTKPFLSEGEFKLNRKRLAKDLSEGRMKLVTPENVEQAALENDVLLIVRKAFSDALGKPENEIGYTTDFFLDEGGSSLDFFAMLVTLEKTFDLEFPEVEGKTAFSMKEIHEYIEEQLRHGRSDL